MALGAKLNDQMSILPIQMITLLREKGSKGKAGKRNRRVGGARRFSCGHADARTRDLFRQAVLGAPQYHYTAAPVAKGIVCSRVPVSILAS